MHNTKKILLTFSLLITTSLCFADITIPIQLSKDGKSIGNVIAKDNQYGLLLEPHLTNLPPGTHGFHIHESPSCEKMAMAAGGHLDPGATGAHAGPYASKGHLGDLPVLIVNADGTATIPVLAPRLTTKMIHKHSLMIHTGSDNYSDQPTKLGGGGERLACGVIN